MKIFLRYLKLQEKRSLQVLRKSILTLCVISIVLFAGIAAVSYTLLQSQFLQILDVTVVIPEKEQEIELVTQFVSAMDSVKSICTFQYLQEEEAMTKLHHKETDAVIVLPEGLFNNINMGNSMQVDMYFPEKTSLNTNVFRELFSAGMSLFHTTESGIYASLSNMQVYQTSMSMEEVGNKICYLFIKEAMQRGRIFDENIVSSVGEVNLYQYYGIAVLLILLLMIGLNCGFLYQKQNKSLEERLRIYGMNQWKINIAKILTMTSILWMISSIIYIITYIVSEVGEYYFIEFSFAIILGLLLLSLLIALYFHIIYCLAGNTIYGSVILLIVNIIMILCSGLIVPLVYFPEKIQMIGVILPLNIWSQYGLSMIFDTLTFVQIGKMLGILGIELGIGAIVSCKNT